MVRFSLQLRLQLFQFSVYLGIELLDLQEKSEKRTAQLVEDQKQLEAKQRATEEIQLRIESEQNEMASLREQLSKDRQSLDAKSSQISKQIVELSERENKVKTWEQTDWSRLQQDLKDREEDLEIRQQEIRQQEEALHEEIDRLDSIRAELKRQWSIDETQRQVITNLKKVRNENRFFGKILRAIWPFGKK